MIWQSDSPTRMALELEWKEEENAKLREENEKLREENEKLRAALRGLFKPDGVPYAQWTREMHAAHIALESE
jgi:hypothetical protein